MAFNLFSLTPDAPESIQYFAMKRATLLAEAKGTLASLYTQVQDLAPIEESFEFDRLQYQVQISSITAESIEYFAVKRSTLLAEAKASHASFYPHVQDLAPVEESSEFDRLQHQVQISSFTADRTTCSFTDLLTDSEEDIPS
ncbi:hypothetical protein R1flu_017367 [Riccia fluitans]|uniref:Uncharacterized protein n=1 Tax=Riccia fluitans TaxID=41844 RepID=A0ABD1ZG56_9MARC